MIEEYRIVLNCNKNKVLLEKNKELPQGWIETGEELNIEQLKNILINHSSVQNVEIDLQLDNHGHANAIRIYIVETAGTSNNVDLEAVTKRIEEWHLVHNDEHFNLSKSVEDEKFNITGWQCSYTNKVIADVEMKEWVDSTVSRILALKPKNVLEIGCGTGLILFRVANLCNTYHATDFSLTALEYISSNIKKQEKTYSNVHLYHYEANDISGFSQGQFDTIIINSVIQYFPSEEYLTTVLVKLLGLLSPGGRIFIGDVRNYSLMDIFISSLCLKRFSDLNPKQQIREKIEQMRFNEAELLLSPDYFYDLGKKSPFVLNVKVEPKISVFRNEMSKYRYDVTIETQERARKIVKWFEWTSFEKNKLNLMEWVDLHNPDCFGISNVLDARIEEDIENNKQLCLDNKLIISGSNINNRSFDSGVEPQQWLNLLGDKYTIEFIIPPNAKPGYYNVTFTRIPSSNVDLISKNEENHTFIKCKPFSNNPLQVNIYRKKVHLYRRFIKLNDFQSSVPINFVFLNRIPIKADGEIDYSCLKDINYMKLDI